MQETIITFETAKLAKEKNFDWKISKFYAEPPNAVKAPTQSLLQKWLREKRIDITVITDWKKAKRVYYVGFIFVNDKNQINIWFSKDEDKNKIEYFCYEDALEIGLQESLKLIEIVKE